MANKKINKKRNLKNERSKPPTIIIGTLFTKLLYPLIHPNINYRFTMRYYIRKKMEVIFFVL